MNNINPGSLPLVTPVKPEAANSQTVNTGSGEVHQNANRQAASPSPAALVSLDTFITTELNKLGQTLLSRSAIVDKLPPQAKELVRNILQETQSTQTVLPQGLAALLKSPQTAAEKLLLLAAALETEAGFASEPPVKTDINLPGKPQSAVADPASAWKNFNPETLKAAATLLRESVATPQPGTDAAAAGRQELPSTALPTGNTANPPLPPHSPAAAVPPSANQNPAQLQDLVNLIKASLAQPELIKNLPPELRKLLQTMVLQEETTLPGQLMPQPSPEAPASLVRQPQTAPEKLLHLASALEQAAETATAEPAPAAGQLSAKANAGVQPDLAEAARALRGKNPEELKATAGMIRELAETMPRAGGVLAERQDNQRVLSFTTLLYFDDGKTAYPAHIHLFHQQEEDQKHPGQPAAETWLRICLETENLGTVDTLFRLHDRDTVDIKVQFDDQSAAAAFATGANEIKDKLRELPLTLGEFLIK